MRLFFNDPDIWLWSWSIWIFSDFLRVPFFGGFLTADKTTRVGKVLREFKTNPRQVPAAQVRRSQRSSELREAATAAGDGGGAKPATALAPAS